jgi:hypothetical protein
MITLSPTLNQTGLYEGILTPLTVTPWAPAKSVTVTPKAPPKAPPPVPPFLPVLRWVVMRMWLREIRLTTLLLPPLLRRLLMRHFKSLLLPKTKTLVSDRPVLRWIGIKAGVKKRFPDDNFNAKPESTSCGRMNIGGCVNAAAFLPSGWLAVAVVAVAAAAVA